MSDTHPAIEAAREALFADYDAADGDGDGQALTRLAHNTTAILSAVDSVLCRSSSVFRPGSLRCSCEACRSLCLSDDAIVKASESVARWAQACE